MLTNLELINWKTHVNSSIKFQKGVNLFIGIMGAGKSSITDAISFALFGTFPDLIHRKIKLIDIITNKPDRKKYCEVKLSFFKDYDYTVIRRIDNKGATSAVLKKENNIIQESSSKVTEEITTILSIDYDTFSKAIYSEQNKLNYFLELTKKDRKSQIDEMLGLDQFSTAEDNINSLINDIKKTIINEESIISESNIKEFDEKISELKKENNTLELNQNQIKKQYEEEYKILKLNQKEFEKLKKDYELKKQISDQIIKIKTTVNTLKEELDKLTITFNENDLKEIKEQKTKQKLELEKKLKEMDNEQKIINKKIIELEQEIKQIKRKKVEKETLDKELDRNNEFEIKNKIDNNEKILEELKSKYIHNETLKNQTKDSIKNLKENKEQCPVCDREFKEEQRIELINKKTKLLIKIEEELKKTNEEIPEKNEIKKELKKIFDQISLIKNKLKEYEGFDSNVKKYEQEHKTLSSKIENVNELVVKTNNQRNELINEINKIENKFEKLIKKREYEKNIEKNKNELEIKQNNYNEINVDEKKLDILQKQLKEIEISIKIKESKIPMNQEKINNLKQQINETQKQVDKFKSFKEKINIKKYKVNNLNKFKKALSEVQMQLRNRLIKSVNKLMINLWAEIYPYTDFSGIRLMPKEDDYLLEINQRINNDEDWVSVNSVGSGGEKSTAALTLRIALSMVIAPNLKMLILDEPTHNLDTNGIRSFIEILDNKLPDIIEQIFVITHDETLKQMNSANIYILERDKNNNKATEIINI